MWVFELAFYWFKKSILQPTPKELNDSIQELTNYRNRLRSEIINMSQKLRISKVKIQEALQENDELNKIENTIKQLKDQSESTNS